MSKPAVVTLAFLAVTLAGCIGAAPPQDEVGVSQGPPEAVAEPANRTWTVNGTWETTMILGAQTPYVATTQVSSRTGNKISFEVKVPANATRLTAEVLPQPDDGSGELTVHLVSPSYETTRAQGTENGSRWVTQPDPAIGVWDVDVHAHPVAYDQTWTTEITVEGEGDGRDEVEMGPVQRA